MASFLIAWLDYAFGLNLSSMVPPIAQVVPELALQVGVQVIVSPRMGAGAGAALRILASITPVAAVTVTCSV